LPLQGFEVAHPIFDDIPNAVARCFAPPVPNDSFHCQTPLKAPNLTYLALKNASWQIWLRIEIG